MRVIVLKDFALYGRIFRAGEAVEINPKLAKDWQGSGLVMKEKSVKGGKVETEISKVKS